MGVRGLAPLDTTMSGKGLDVGEGICVHHLTLTKPGGIGKDIGAGALRVLSGPGRAGLALAGGAEPVGGDGSGAHVLVLLAGASAGA